MQGRSQRGGFRGGRRGFGGPLGGGGNKQDKSTGTGGMTPGPGPGGLMVAGATPSPSGVAIGGTTAGFAGGPTPGSGGGQSLQDLFAAQQPPAQGIATLPTNEEMMQTINEMTFGPLESPSFTAFETFRNLPFDPTNVFGFPPSEDDTSSFESGESVIDNLRSILDPQFNVGIGTVDVDVDPRGFFNNNPNIGFNLSVPLN
tara:strand:+ start:449 stop:1051 length:603 start_codon:yes stop_codon:yes gene_type:complete